MAIDHPEASEDLPEPDPRVEAINDRRVWTLDRRLAAMGINAIQTHTALSVQWKDGPPEFPIIGPADWQSPAEKPKEAERVYTDNFDFFRQMGWPCA